MRVKISSYYDVRTLMMFTNAIALVLTIAVLQNGN